MKKINLYLVALYAILIHSLVFTMIWPEMAAMAALLLKLSFDSYLASKATKEDSEPIKAELKKISDKTNQLENSIKLINFRKNG